MVRRDEIRCQGHVKPSSLLVLAFVACGPASSAPVEQPAPLPSARRTDSAESGPSVRVDDASPPQGRAPAVTRTEIEQLATLFASTPQSSPERASIARRLAEDWVELEVAAPNDLTRASARVEVMKYYTLLETDFPTYPQLDEVYFRHAYECEQAHDPAKAQSLYGEIVQRFPSSKYAANAYLAIGEMYFDQAQSDPSKLDFAAQAYYDVLKHPPPANAVYGYAWYKLAFIFWNKGEYEKSLNAFKKVVDFATQFPTVTGAAKLGDAARKDVIPVYAKIGAPAQAFNFFHTMSNDPPGTNVRTLAMMGALGQTYLDNVAYADAAALYRDLQTRDAAHKCRWDTYVKHLDGAMKTNFTRAALDADLAQCP